MNPVTNADRELCLKLIVNTEKNTKYLASSVIFYAVNGTRWRIEVKNGRLQEEKLPDTYNLGDYIPDPNTITATAELVKERVCILNRQKFYSRTIYSKPSYANAYLTSDGRIEVFLSREAMQEELDYIKSMLKRNVFETYDDYSRAVRTVEESYREAEYYASELPTWENIVCTVYAAPGGILGIDEFGYIHYCFYYGSISGCLSFKLFETLCTAREEWTSIHDGFEKKKQEYFCQKQELNTKYDKVRAASIQMDEQVREAGLFRRKSLEKKARELDAELKSLRDQLNSLGEFVFRASDSK